MEILKIKIANILGLEALEFSPARGITRISGQNGSGKTSCLDAIRAALGQGHDATLLRHGAAEGEVVLLLDDGTEIRKRITEEKSDTQVIHPEFGKISKPATYLKKLADALSLNPVQFLTAPAKDRVNLLLQAIPMTITADKLAFVPQIALTGIDLDKHALEVIGSIDKAIYDLRTGVNRSQKDKEATARQMTETLPADAPEGDWGDVLRQANDGYLQLRKTTSDAIAAINKEAQDTENTLKNDREKHVAEVKAELEAAIEKLRADSQIEIDRTIKASDIISHQIESVKKDALAASEAEYRPKEAELKEKIGQAKAMVEQHAKAKSTREFIGTLTTEANALEAQSTNLTQSRSRLEVLKASLLEKLPIEGLEVKDGDIYVGGLPFDRVNESKRIRLAIEIAKLRAGSLGLVIVDGLERLDSKSMAAFEKEAKKSGLQFVVAEVNDAPLQIETEVA